MRSSAISWVIHIFRFLAVGGINTLIGYSSFALLYLTVFQNLRLGYIPSLIGSYAIAVPVAYMLYKKYVFTSSTPFRFEKVNFIAVYCAAIFLNLLVLPLLVEIFGTKPLLGQVIALMLGAIASYFGHRYISFRGSG